MCKESKENELLNELYNTTAKHKTLLTVTMERREK